MHQWGKRALLFWERYSRHINIASLTAGFCFDLYLAKRPDSVPDNILLIFYLLLSAVLIIALNIRSRWPRGAESPAEPLLLLLVLQFCFGGLANNLLVLYGHSGTLGGSFLFFALLAGFALGNEFLKNRYALLRFNIAVYYFLLLTYCVIAVPTFLLHAIGWQPFIVSGFVSLGVISVFLFVLLRLLSPNDRRKNAYESVSIVLGIFFAFNLLYYFNVIPPVPLSLKQIGIYHSLVALPASASGDAIYSASYEPAEWYAFWRDTSATYTLGAGAPDAYCYSAIYAPGSLSAPVRHRWEYFDPSSKHWETVSTVSFPISGGRAGGYRGYSLERSLTLGAWRCDVETTTGALIGRISFNVTQDQGEPALSTTNL